MRFGCCVSLEQLEAAAGAGYDYAELPVEAVLPEKPEGAFAPVRDRLLASPVKPEAWRLHLPEDLWITGPEVDWPRLARYAYTALRRAAAVGGAVVGFCSGPSRRVPDGFPEAEAVQQAAEFLRICGVVARGQGMTVGIEPLSPGSSNFVNSLPEAVALARRVGLPEVGVLPNITHMLSEGQSLLDMVDASEWLAHVHVSSDCVASLRDEETVRDLVSAMRMSDYDWRMSVTGRWEGERQELQASRERLEDWFEGTDGAP